jgi:hypothetical protein
LLNLSRLVMMDHLIQHLLSIFYDFCKIRLHNLKMAHSMSLCNVYQCYTLS